MSDYKKICIYCGSNAGNDPIYIKAAQELGMTLAKQHISLVYGGAKVGLMGVIANSVLSHGGEVIGVIPERLVEVEVAHHHLSELHIVKNMHERKALMTELSDGFIMMPGGSGSLEEFFEIWTAAQLGFHLKPCGILNINNYYEHILHFIDHAVNSGFIKSIYRDMLLIDHSPSELLEKFMQYQAPTESKWINVKAVPIEI